MTVENKFNCILCDAEINYSEDYSLHKCIYCKGEFQSNTACKNGHYVCDSCHALKGVDLIYSYCLETLKSNPMDMANDIMGCDGFKMHGPEHHFLAPAVLLSSYCNVQNLSYEEKKKMLLVAKKRAEDVKGGFCGFYGSCGAAVGCGMFLSIITGTTPLTKDTWGLVNEGTGKCLIKLSEIGGPRCCKKGMFTSINIASRILDEKMNIRLYDYENEVKCTYSKYNKECIGKDCPHSIAYKG
ncbi:MAG: DUF5714 domain-containing protein [Clostridium sp.]